MHEQFLQLTVGLRLVFVRLFRFSIFVCVFFWFSLDYLLHTVNCIRFCFWRCLWLFCLYEISRKLLDEFCCLQCFDTVGWAAGRESACKKWEDGGGGHWLVRMEWRPAGLSVCLPLLIFPCTIKSRSSFLAPAHPGGPGKRVVKQLWCWTNLCHGRRVWYLAQTSLKVKVTRDKTRHFLPLLAACMQFMFGKTSLACSFYCVVCFCCVRFCFFRTTPRDWLGRASEKWPILCRVGRKTLTQSITDHCAHPWGMARLSWPG